MFNYKKIKIQCPDCGEVFDFDLYESINVTLNSELREKVLIGEVFGKICPKCCKPVKVDHPLMYHNMDKHYMVYYNDHASLLNFREDHLSYKNLDSVFLDMVGETKIIGVTELCDLITAIVALDNDLDYRVIKMALLHINADFMSQARDNNLGILDVYSIGLTGQRGEDGNLHIFIEANENGTSQLFNSTLQPALYEACVEAYKERLDLVNPFIFDNMMAGHFLNTMEDDFEAYEKNKIQFVFVEEGNGNIIICDKIPTYLEDTIGIGSYVVVKLHKGTRMVGTITKIVEYNPLCINIAPECRGTIMCQYAELHMSTTADTGAFLDQDPLLDKLVAFKNDGYDFKEGEIARELEKSSMFICEMAEQFMDFNELFELIEKDERSGRVKPIVNVQKVERNGKLYLAVYTDKFHLPRKDEHLSNAAFLFNDLVRIIKNDPRYDGIIINQYDEDIILDFDTIFTYISYTIFGHEDKAIELMNKLTDKEREYIGEKDLGIFKVYSDAENTKEDAAKILNISVEEVDRAQAAVFTKLQEIIYSKF